MAIEAAARTAKSILSKSGIPGVQYAINPYVGCEHACVYCYATFMARYSGHVEPWGTFVDAKQNAPELLERELSKKHPVRVMISSVTDCYQPVEHKWRLTRSCIEILLSHGVGVDILTKSPLVLRDLDLFTGAAPGLVEVGMTVTTDDDRIRAAFEPRAPAIRSRVEALRRLHEAGVRTYAFVGPILPMNPEALAAMLAGAVDSVLVDRMNYSGKSASVYQKLGQQRWLQKAVMDDAGHRFGAELKKLSDAQQEFCF